MSSWWDKILIKSVSIFGIGPFKEEFTYYMDSRLNVMIGLNNTGKTFILKSLEFFFNENKYTSTLKPEYISQEVPHIKVNFEVSGMEASIKKTLSLTRSSIKVQKTFYSNDSFPTILLDYMELCFVYYFSSERLLTEKDTEFSFIVKSITSKLLEHSENAIHEIDKDLDMISKEYKNNILNAINEEFEISHSLSLKTGLKVQLDWKEDPFKGKGSGQRKKLALSILLSYIQARAKGPSILLIDCIEAHLDYLNLQKTISRLQNLNTSLQILTTFSKGVVDFVSDDYSMTILLKNTSSNSKTIVFKQDEIDKILH